MDSKQSLREYLAESTSAITEDFKYDNPSKEERDNLNLTAKRLEQLARDLEAKGIVQTLNQVDYFLLKPRVFTTEKDIQRLSTLFYESLGYSFAGIRDGFVNFENGDNALALTTVNKVGTDFAIIGRRVHTARIEDEMRGYEELTDYLGGMFSPRLQFAAKQIYDLGASTVDDPYHIEALRQVFEGLLTSLHTIFHEYSPEELEHLTIDATTDDRVDKDVLLYFIMDAQDIIENACNSLLNCQYLDSFEQEESFLEKMMGAYVLGYGGDMKAYPRDLQENNRMTRADLN